MINGLHPKLREAWHRLQSQYASDEPGKTLILTCGHRSPEAQRALYTKGRSWNTRLNKWIIVEPGKIVTYCDGTTVKSQHNFYPSRAFDFAVLIGGKVSWDPEEYMVPGAIAESLGMEWGGSWKSFKDYPHVQLPKDA